MNLSMLTKQIETSVAPFESWQPESCGEIDIEIKANGDWYFQATKIDRLNMVKLFARVLTKEQNHYYLKTPIEKMRIRVEDAPFLITHWYEKEEFIICCDNLNREYILGDNHPLELKSDVPYLHLHHGVLAKVSRNVFYQWAEIANEKKGRFAICSGGQDFFIG